LPRLWATRRVGWLLDEIRLHGDNAELREEVTELARRYGIVTPYTSYLIVEDESRRGVPREARTMQQLGEDREARELGKQMWNDMSSVRDGLAAASVARENQAYRYANAPAAAASSGAVEYNRSMGLGGSAGSFDARTARPELRSKARLAEYTQQTAFAGGRTFFLNDGQWIDSLVQGSLKARRVQVRFGSPEYFELSRKNPGVLPWLALGNNVQFLMGDVVYEVTEKSNE
jgi:Ca-activated chloride channel homolog